MSFQMFSSHQLKLWWSKTPGQADQLRDDKILRNKKKVAINNWLRKRGRHVREYIFWQVLQMLVLVVIAFAICWAPWQTYFLAAIVHPPVNQ